MSNFLWMYTGSLKDQFRNTVLIISPQRFAVKKEEFHCFYLCSMRVGDHKHGQNVFFHATGLSGDNNPSRGTNWKMRTLQKQREELGHSKVCLTVSLGIASYTPAKSLRYLALFVTRTMDLVKQAGAN